MKFLRYSIAALALLCMPVAANATARFLVACTTACTWDNSSTLIWSTTSGGAAGSSAPGSSDAVTLDANSCVGGVTCTITVNANLTIQSITMGACTASTAGCILDFSANNNNVTLNVTNGLSLTGTGTRTLNMGNGTWTLSSASGTLFDATTKTNLTFNANSSTIAITNTAPTGTRSFIGNGLSFSTITVAATTSGQLLTITTGPTIATLTVTEPVNIAFGAAVTTTITNAVSFVGSSGSEGYLAATGNGAATLSVAGGATISWMALSNLTFTGAVVSATNSFDLRGNNMNGGSITPPSGGGGGGSYCIGC